MIVARGLTVGHGGFRLARLDLSVPGGCYGVLMGATGSGKTTLVECLCGLRAAEAGTIRIGSREVTGTPPGVRGIGYVPQDGALFPTMTVAEHLAFALTVRRWPAAARAARVAEVAEQLGVTALLARRPQGLSGGERQRVALGRALAYRPAAMILDEPLSALDESAHGEMCALLRTVQRATGVTVLHVTHSRREAALLADRLWQLADGALAELAVPSQGATAASTAGTTELPVR